MHISKYKAEYEDSLKKAEAKKENVLKWCETFEKTRIPIIGTPVISETQLVTMEKKFKEFTGKNIFVDYVKFSDNKFTLKETAVEKLETFTLDSEMPWLSRVQFKGVSRPIFCCVGKPGISNIQDAMTSETLFSLDSQLIAQMNGNSLDAIGAKVEVFGTKYFEAAKKEALYGPNSLVKYCKERLDNLKTVPQRFSELCDRGFKVIYPEKRDEFAKRVGIDLVDLYNGLIIINAIEIMEYLETKDSTMEGADKTLSDANHSGMSFSIARNIVTHFSKRGLEFRKHVNRYFKDNTLDKCEKAEIDAYLKQVAKQNAQLEVAAEKRRIAMERRAFTSDAKKSPKTSQSC